MGEVVRHKSGVVFTLDADVGPMRVFDAMFAVNQELSKRYVEQSGRVGLYGNWPRIRRELAEYFLFNYWNGEPFLKSGRAPKSFNLCGIEWREDKRLGPHMIVAWHPSAIIPPAIVLRREAIVYCSLTQRVTD